jgi:hypothetical protein
MAFLTFSPIILSLDAAQTEVLKESSYKQQTNMSRKLV